MLFYRLAKHISSNTSPKTASEATELGIVLIQWLEASLSAYHAAQDVLALGPLTEELTAQIMALGTLAIAVLENALVMGGIAKGRVGKGNGLGVVLGGFVPVLMQCSPQSAARLELFRSQTLVMLEPVEKGKGRGKGAEGEIDDILDGGAVGGAGGIEGIVVVELPVVNSRAGLYIYLNALVSNLDC